MFGSQIRTLLSVLTVLVLTVAAWAQSPQDAPAPSGGSTAQTSTPSPRGQHGNCWKKAGITPDKINERWKIQDAGKVKISGVCSDPKLTAAQRVERIHSINEETDKEIAKLIPAQQLSVYKSCMTQREAEAKVKARGPQPKELGPCGGTMPSSSKDHGSHDHSMMSSQN